jgi:hypothetical protein
VASDSEGKDFRTVPPPQAIRLRFEQVVDHEIRTEIRSRRSYEGRMVGEGVNKEHREIRSTGMADRDIARIRRDPRFRRGVGFENRRAE